MIEVYSSYAQRCCRYARLLLQRCLLIPKTICLSSHSTLKPQTPNITLKKVNHFTNFENYKLYQFAQCLKITKKVSFYNIEASYIYSLVNIFEFFAPKIFEHYNSNLCIWEFGLIKVITAHKNRLCNDSPSAKT